MIKHAASLVVFLFAAACGTPDAAPVDRTAGTPAVASPAATPTIHGDWRARVQAEVAALKADAPALYAELTALAPSRTRAGLPRFTQTLSSDPRATSVLLDRLVRGGAVAERLALAEALGRTTGTYADALVDLLDAEATPEVRGVLVFVARRAPADHALRVLQRGFADASPEVVAEAARVAAGHAAGVHLAGELRTALTSTAAPVRAEAARTLGLLGVAAARTDLLARLADGDADVRLASLRALDQLAPGSVTLATLGTLARDADPRVARLAARLADTAVR